MGGAAREMENKAISAQPTELELDWAGLSLATNCQANMHPHDFWPYTQLVSPNLKLCELFGKKVQGNNYQFTSDSNKSDNI